MNRGWLLLSLFGVALFAFGSSQPAVAKEDEIPAVVLSGLKAYQAGGAEAAAKAVRTWLAGSHREGDKAALAQAGRFEQAEALYGRYIGFHLVKVVDVSASTRFVYLQMDFQKGPLFVRFVCYRTESGWIIPGFDSSTRPEEVIPLKLLYGKWQ